MGRTKFLLFKFFFLLLPQSGTLLFDGIMQEKVKGDVRRQSLWGNMYEQEKKKKKKKKKKQLAAGFLV